MFLMIVLVVLVMSSMMMIIIAETMKDYLKMFDAIYQGASKNKLKLEKFKNNS